MTSAYPITLDTLTERVKARAIELGHLPSRNRIKTEFKVGAPKATAVLEALKAAGFDPAHLDAAEVEVPARRLHSVPAAEVDDTESAPVVEPVPAPVAKVEPTPLGAEVTEGANPVKPTEVDETPTVPRQTKRVRSWPLLLLAAGAFVAIWGGWVGLGEKAGFGPIRLLPGIADGFVINSAITLPIGVEAYAAYALRVWLAAQIKSQKARRFAKWSAIGSLVLGAAGQVAYHLMEAAGVDVAPWWITTFVSCLPVVVLGCGAALTHLLHDETEASR